MEAEIAPLERGAEMVQELPAKQLAEHSHGKEETWTGGDPSGAVRREPSAWDEAVDVGMVLNRLAPCVQNGKYTDLGPQVLRVLSDGAQGLRRCPEQDVVDHLLVLQGDACQLMGNREDDVEVLDGQDLSLALRGPLGARCLLALGAVSVSARIVRDTLMPAPLALLNVPAPCSRSAGSDVIEHTSLGSRDPTGAIGDEVISMG